MALRRYAEIGVDPNIGHAGWSPLYATTYFNEHAVMELLLQHDSVP
jgi:hypothetical protein